MIKTRARATQTDLFSWSAGAKPAGNVAAGRQHLLPKDLETGIRRLTDQEFDRLLAAVRVEEKRRRKMSPLRTSHKMARGGAAPHLTSAKLNAIRAAFKAGVTPSRIAKQFGISRVDVRNALARGASEGGVHAKPDPREP